MMAGKGSSTGSIRVGPITVVAFVIILSMAVLAVLSVTTANANSRQADRQQASIAGTYALDAQGQEFLAELDGMLDEAAEAGTGRDEAAAQAAARLGAEADGSTISASLSNTDGRTLRIELSIDDDLTYSVTRWSTTTDWTAGNQGKLWSGN